MRLLRIDCNKNNPDNGGFRHTVFDIETLNGQKKINNIASIKFDEVLTDQEWITHLTKNPDEFMKDLLNDEKDELGDTASNINIDCNV